MSGPTVTENDSSIQDGSEEDLYDPMMTQSTGHVNQGTIMTGSQYQGRWTDEEHDKFMQGLKLFGKDWRRIEDFIGSRSCA